MLSPESLSIAALQQLECGRIDEAILRIYLLLKNFFNPHVNTVPFSLIREHQQWQYLANFLHKTLSINTYLSLYL